jgi:hypothetical protein
MWLRIKLHVATDSRETYVIRKLQRGLNSVESWYEQWNIEMDEVHLFLT